MKIARVKAHPMSMKLDKIYWTSRAPWGTYNTIVVEVETDEGITGIGTINKTPLKDIAEITDSLESVIKGMDALAHEAVWNRIFNLTVPHIEAGETKVTRPIFDQHKRVFIMAALAGIDLALWDIKGKAFKLPMWRLLGGNKREVPAYASGGYYEEGRSPLAVIDEMAGYVAQGYSAVKMKCGGADIPGDIARISGVRKAMNRGSASRSTGKWSNAGKFDRRRGGGNIGAELAAKRPRAAEQVPHASRVDATRYRRATSRN